MKILITGGAGFVGASMARLFQEQNCEVTAFDNLKRRGSELNLPDFRRRNIQFVHGDIRQPSDFDSLQGNFDVVIEASAEPSVHAGVDGKGLRYLLDTNVTGTLNCLEFTRLKSAGMIFLSTSRVYAIAPLRGLNLRETPSRLELEAEQDFPGISEHGVDESFPMTGHGPRSFYGSTKLASELFVEEYAKQFDLPCAINRCGVIAGPGQFGRTDQGVFTLWVARHVFGGSLTYTGFGGIGGQVRDLLHPSDLFSLTQKEISAMEILRGETYCVGGGRDRSVSLREYTTLCQQVTGNRIDISSVADTASVDIPWFIADSRKAQAAFDWAPAITPKTIVQEIADWLESESDSVRTLFR
jgi:CDP-paratose 2-epimerase